MEGRGMFLVAKAKEFLCLLFTIFTAALSWLINCGNVTDWVSRTSHLTPHTSPQQVTNVDQHLLSLPTQEMVSCNTKKIFECLNWLWQGKSPHLPRMFLHYTTVQVCERCFSYQDVQTIKTECNHSGIVTVLSSCH